jgi:hypothetical protein
MGIFMDINILRNLVVDMSGGKADIESIIEFIEDKISDNRISEKDYQVIFMKVNSSLDNTRRLFFQLFSIGNKYREMERKMIQNNSDMYFPIVYNNTENRHLGILLSFCVIR